MQCFGSVIEIIVIGESAFLLLAAGFGGGVGEGEGDEGVFLAVFGGVILRGGLDSGVFIVSDLDIAKAAGLVADGGEIGGDGLRGGDLEGLAGQAVDSHFIQLKRGEGSRAAGDGIEEEGSIVLLEGHGVVIPDDDGAAGDGAVVQQVLEQGLVRERSGVCP